MGQDEGVLLEAMEQGADPLVMDEHVVLSMEEGSPLMHIPSALGIILEREGERGCDKIAEEDQQ